MSNDGIWTVEYTNQLSLPKVCEGPVIIILSESLYIDIYAFQVSCNTKTWRADRYRMPSSVKKGLN
jgi:hypothetical protein